MDGWMGQDRMIYGRMDDSTTGQHMDGTMDGIIKMNGWNNRTIYRSIDEWIELLDNLRMDGWKSGWDNIQMDE